MSTPLTGIDPANIANTAFTDAKRVRAMAEYLEGNLNDAAAAKTWHKVADALHEAAALIDSMQTATR